MISRYALRQKCLLAMSFLTWSLLIPTSASAFTSTCSWYNNGGEPVLYSDHTYSAGDALYGDAINVITTLNSPYSDTANDVWVTDPSGDSVGHSMIASTGTLFSFDSEAFIGTVIGNTFYASTGSDCTGDFLFNPPHASVLISPSVVSVGDPVSITWSSTGATSCKFDGSPIGVNGSHSFTAALSDSRAYTLECQNQWGTTEASAVLTVN